MTALEKIESIRDHIQNVERNCYRLGKKLILAGEEKLGVDLIANGQIHDNSKFKGLEFQHLHRNDSLLKDAAQHHAKTNPHHPEYWNGIHNMPDLYLAEMVCDCAARSAELAPMYFYGFVKNTLRSTVTLPMISSING